MSGVTVPADVVGWLRTGERGLSSEFMVEHLFGLPVRSSSWGGVSHPEDPADFRRCALLVGSCPSVAERLHDMRNASARWASLVHWWSRLELVLDHEVPGWREKEANGNAPYCYQLMNLLRDAAEQGVGNAA